MIAIRPARARRRGPAPAALVLPLLLCAASARAACGQEPAAPPGRPDPSFTLRVETLQGAAQHGILDVREWGRGQRLHFGRHLGIRVVGELAVTGEWHTGARRAEVLRIGHLFLWGGARPPADLLFNGVTFAGHRRLESRPLWLEFECWHREALWRRADGTSVSALLGVRCDFLSWFFHGSLAPTTWGHDTHEGFGRQAMPLPFAGVSAHVRLGPGLCVDCAVRGTRVWGWNTYRVEGGGVFLWASVLDVRCDLGWVVTPGLELRLGYHGFALTLDARSREDQNRVHVAAHGATLGLAWRF